MARYYKLLSGEKINLRTLKKSEREHIKSLERCIKNCENHDKKDYFLVGRQGVAKFTEGQFFTATRARELYNSSYYKIINDQEKRYCLKIEEFKKEGRQVRVNIIEILPIEEAIEEVNHILLGIKPSKSIK